MNQATYCYNLDKAYVDFQLARDFSVEKVKAQLKTANLNSSSTFGRTTKWLLKGCGALPDVKPDDKLDQIEQTKHDYRRAVFGFFTKYGWSNLYPYQFGIESYTSSELGREAASLQCIQPGWYNPFTERNINGFKEVGCPKQA